MPDLPARPTRGSLAPNLASALAYSLGPITGIFFLVTEKESAFVRFHAAQSIVVSIAMFAASVALSVVGAMLAVIPIIGWMVGLSLSLLLGLGSFVLWLVLMFRAFQGERWEIPGLAPYASRLLESPAGA